MQLPALWLSLQNDYLIPSPDALPTLFSSGFDDGQHFLLALLFTLGVYGPLIGALVASRADGRMMQWRDWFRPALSGWRVGQMLLISLIIATIPLLLGAVTGTVDFANYSLLDGLGIFVPMLLFQLFTSGLEEPGWRGYMLPRLQASSTEDWDNGWSMGFWWAVWHYPFVVFLTYPNMANEPLPAIIIGILITLLGFTMNIIGMSLIYVWLFNRSGSVSLAIMFHALNNSLFVLYPSVDAGPLSLVLGLMPWCIVLALRGIYGKDWLSRA
ncbi:MAG: CPBP family intramembrane glutamic endopeptidase [Ardenticatenaceae bacterium]